MAEGSSTAGKLLRGRRTADLPVRRVDADTDFTVALTLPRQDLPGAPLAWQEALQQLVHGLTRWATGWAVRHPVGVATG